MSNKTTISCIGSGLIGYSWATLFSAHDYKVNIYDVDEGQLEKAKNKIKENLELLAEYDQIDPDIDSHLANISTEKELESAVENADYVQESVAEDLEIKRKVFKEIEKYKPEEAIIATSSSTIPISNIAEPLNDPEKCLNAHPFNPPHIVKLVELVKGDKTSEKTFQQTKTLMEDVEKTPVRVKKEVPGFIANRLQAAIIREIVDMVNRDIAEVGDIDKAMRAGPGIRWSFMGPFLVFHLGTLPDGIDIFFDRYGGPFSEIWKSMGDWDHLPHEAVSKCIEQTKDLEELKVGKSDEEMVSWRDQNLLNILKSIKKVSEDE